MQDQYGINHNDVCSLLIDDPPEVVLEKLNNVQILEGMDEYKFFSQTRRGQRLRQIEKLAHSQARKNAIQIIYFMCDPHKQYLKIGITDDLRRRQKQLQRALPFNLVLIAAFKGSLLQEQDIHSYLIQDAADSPHLKNEWYTYQNKHIQHVLCFCFDKLECVANNTEKDFSHATK